MRSLFGRIFAATFIIYPVTRALGLLALWLFGVGLPFNDPPPFRHLLEFYGAAALAAYESGGQPGLDRFIAGEQQLTRSQLELGPMPPDARRKVEVVLEHLRAAGMLPEAVRTARA